MQVLIICVLNKRKYIKPFYQTTNETHRSKTISSRVTWTLCAFCFWDMLINMIWVSPVPALVSLADCDVISWIISKCFTSLKSVQSKLRGWNDWRGVVYESSADGVSYLFQMISFIVSSIFWKSWGTLTALPFCAASQDYSRHVCIFKFSRFLYFSIQRILRIVYMPLYSSRYSLYDNMGPFSALNSVVFFLMFDLFIFISHVMLFKKVFLLHSQM